MVVYHDEYCALFEVIVSYTLDLLTCLRSTRVHLSRQRSSSGLYLPPSVLFSTCYLKLQIVMCGRIYDLFIFIPQR